MNKETWLSKSYCTCLHVQVQDIKTNTCSEQTSHVRVMLYTKQYTWSCTYKCTRDIVQTNKYVFFLQMYP